MSRRRFQIEFRKSPNPSELRTLTDVCNYLVHLLIYKVQLLSSTTRETKDEEEEKKTYDSKI